MKSEKLNEAIALIRAGRNNDAREILFDFIRTEPENEVAWIWMAETLASNPDRMKIYHACLQINPESKIAKMAITRLKTLMQDEMHEESLEKPLFKDGTVDPGVRVRTGHTGALIGVDGSYILSEVADFDKVVDLRTQDDEILNHRLESTLNSDNKFANKESSFVGIGNFKELEAEPDLSELLDDVTFTEDRISDRGRELDDDLDLSGLLADEASFSEDRFSDRGKELEAEPDLSGLLVEDDALTEDRFSERGKELEAQTTDRLESDDFSSILDERIFNDVAIKDQPDEKAASLKTTIEDVNEVKEVKEEETAFESSLAEKFLRDDGTGELSDPVHTFQYNFLDESEVELDFEPDLTSFLENENIDLPSSKSLKGSFGLHQEEIEEGFDFEDIPLQAELSLEELGFARTTEVNAEELPVVTPLPIAKVKKELSEEFEFIEADEDNAGKKKRQRKIMFIGAAALILVVGLSLVSVFAFPGILPGAAKITPTPTTPAATLVPTATSEKIVLPPVVTLASGSDITETPTSPPITATQTPVTIGLPSTTIEPTNTPTITGTATSTRFPTRTRTPTNTQQPASNTRTPTPTATRTNTPPPTATGTLVNTSTPVNTPTPTTVPATNTPTTPPTPTRTLVPTITPTSPPTSTPLPTNTPVLFTDTPVPMPAP